ncbi:MAG: hypothetical protein JWP38_1115 [Herbaspirillum sp.]|nr:hypothetical protein [Herbaspirillum sp.]
MKRLFPLIRIACLVLLLAACDNRGTPLLSGLAEDEANTILAVLAQSDIAASKTVASDGASSVYVTSASQAEALARLHERGLPRQNYASLGDIFKKDGIISTPMEEQARYIYALAQELEKTLSQIDDVVYVRVHPVLARKASLSGPAASASAGVLIKHRPDVDLTPLIPQVQQLVAHSIPDLEAANVSIIMAVSDEQERMPANGIPGDPGSAASTRIEWWPAAFAALAMLIAGGVYAVRRFRSGRRSAQSPMPSAALKLHE